LTKDTKQREKERLSPKAMTEMREWLTTMPLSVQNPDKSLQYISDFLAVAAHLRLPQNSRVLELGAGSCWPSEWLYRMGYRTVSSDISIDMLKLPGVMAFEIGSRKGKFIEFEGYSQKVRNYTSERILYNPDTNLSSYCIEHENAFMFNHIEDQAVRLLPEWDRRLDKYKSSISVPFFLESKHAILSVYSDKEELFDVYALKAISVFAAYLEQIT